MSIQITDISELGEVFIMRDIEANVIPSKKGELKRAFAIWTGETRREELEF